MSYVGRRAVGKATTSMRIDMDAIAEAKIAAAVKGESVVSYASRVLMEAALRDQAEWRHAKKGS